MTKIGTLLEFLTDSLQFLGWLRIVIDEITLKKTLLMTWKSPHPNGNYMIQHYRFNWIQSDIRTNFIKVRECLLSYHSKAIHQDKDIILLLVFSFIITLNTHTFFEISGCFVFCYISWFLVIEHECVPIREILFQVH